MAGYIFNLNNESSLEYSMQNGVYSTLMKLPDTAYWRVNHEGTFADYMTMSEGDNVYFFFQRKIYGIGELINIKGNSKFLNFPSSDLPTDFDYSVLRNKMILSNSDENIKNRMLCTFKGSPHFFKKGVDMDEVLSSNPDSFKMLRAFWKRSFIKIDHKENKALLDIILKNNEENLITSNNIYHETDTLKNRIINIVNDNYFVRSENILNCCVNSDGSIGHEMALEAGVLDYIYNKKTSVFGEWDYLTHQVIASPFKPIDYMDKMDVFGYRFIKGFNTISKYLVIEIKRGVADKETVSQLMKYVDWVNQEYSYGDYNMIEAFVVANHFPDEVKDFKNIFGKRKFTKGTRPAQSLEWSNLRLIEYSFDITSKQLNFYEI
ncbi:hypothetical protein QT711_08705 [Sporosarcina saromensis]|uniref:EVE domain-containing protein n=1 Tax=Sporosarcina saromensis TaxID=359365 RepID=A0ABU4GA65_9BACL|nr:hypothetical protein [Sporosarcina saromensis]MDW0113267.1 hypothetical protein [Sporosarcina saromensis]